MFRAFSAKVELSLGHSESCRAKLPLHMPSFMSIDRLRLGCPLADGWMNLEKLLPGRCWASGDNIAIFVEVLRRAVETTTFESLDCGGPVWLCESDDVCIVDPLIVLPSEFVVGGTDEPLRNRFSRGLVHLLLSVGDLTKQCPPIGELDSLKRKRPEGGKAAGCDEQQQADDHRQRCSEGAGGEPDPWLAMRSEVGVAAANAAS